MSLAKNIVRARKGAKMSQAELARALKKSRSSISEYEKGSHLPRIDVLKLIAKVTKTPLEALLA